MTGRNHNYTLKLTTEQFLTVRNCLSEFERMARQRVLRKIECDEHISPDVLKLLASLGEVNDIIFEEHLAEVSVRKQG